MRWFEVTIHTVQDAVELVAHAFHEGGAGGVAIEDPEVLSREWDTMYGELYQLSKDDYPAEGVLVKGYIPETTDVEALCAGMRTMLAELATFGVEVGAATVAVREVFEEDWAHAWKTYYKPVRVSKRLLVKPTWTDLAELTSAVAEVGAVEAGAVEVGAEEAGAVEVGMPAVIEMDPGMAFGTGTHPTTILCMRALEKVLFDGARVIDVGTGTGILAIAAVKLGATDVLAVDLDPVAVDSARRNVALNGVASQVEVRHGDLLHSLGGEGDWYGAADVVVANILADVIVQFVDDVWRALRGGGLYITSGIIVEKAAMVESALAASGFELVEKVVDGEWVALVARKP